MNRHEMDILISIYNEPYINQRMLSEKTGYSIGAVNKSIKSLIEDEYLDKEIRLTQKAINEFDNKKPKNAVILAAGIGMRMVPINTQIPKALVEVNGEPLIERIIKQLHAVNITEIYVVVGFLKEMFEYLIDEYGVELIVNNAYAEKNNLHSLMLASEYIENTYIIPSDIWCDKNPFSLKELYSWYMVTDFVDDNSDVRINRKMELVRVSEKKGGNSMLGVSYIDNTMSGLVKDRLKSFDMDRKYNDAFWEEVLYESDRMIIPAKIVSAFEYAEINTYEQLRELDEDSSHLKTDAISEISKALGVEAEDIVDITVLKKGMTNRSFLFTCDNNKYIMRIPGEGTDQLINRNEEAEVYKVIADKAICDDILYINPKNGYKITKFLNDSRVCDANNIDDIKRCMQKLKVFHDMKLKVLHRFNIFGQIEFYEKLWSNTPSIYRDYKETKEKVYKLKEFIDSQDKEYCLTHIDAVPDNFLFTNDGDIRLIDWEYAAMQDPHVDIAMFSIYALYDKNQIDQLIDIYFDGKCEASIKIKIYCYIAACGLLWSNWCEYKRILGVEFGEYSLRQYRYAKEYYKIAVKEMETINV